MEPIDARLEAMLGRPEPEIADAGFSENVMRALPARRFRTVSIRRWTLGGAALTGGLLTALFGAPLETLLDALAVGHEGAALAIAVVLVAVLAAPAAWTLYSEN